MSRSKMHVAPGATEQLPVFRCSDIIVISVGMWFMVDGGGKVKTIKTAFY